MTLDPTLDRAERPSEEMMMNMDLIGRLPPLVALRAFDVVARTGSIRAASERLLVHHTAVSRHLHNLEDRLATQLVERDGRGISLTEVGKRYHAVIAEAFDMISFATAELVPDSRPQLNLWCAPGIIRGTLLPYFPELQSTLSKYNILLVPTLARPALLAGEADAEIVHLQGPDVSLGVKSELLTQARIFPAASPSFIEAFGREITIEDLPDLPLLHEATVTQWPTWLSHAGVKRGFNTRGPRLWNPFLAIEAAVLGQGVALVNEITGAPRLGDGSLVEIGNTEIYFGGYYLVTRASRKTDKSIEALSEWLHKIFADLGRHK